MADFRQLALDFVLNDDETKLASIAQKTALEIQSAPANPNPVARWVEAVQPWMPGSGDDSMEHDETPNWTVRAKALEFLSRTLDFLAKDVLKPRQVRLLISFFGAMFDVDHKAGIMASATALSRIIVMKSFQPQSGHDIIHTVCALKEDFPRQAAKTRLAVYGLLRSLIADAAVASDLRYRDGAASSFMGDLLHLCQNERDPDCLMVWFDTLRSFLSAYDASQEMVQEVYATFKAYFPIALPRTSQTGMTPDDLKRQLRRCFSCSDRLAPLALPFLLGKLDQGSVVTVNVKLDVLRTIRACIEEYARPELSVAPYVDRIWTSLKYEVRNGEVEDTIWATLEVLKAVTTRLKADELRDYALTVARDCVNDLSNLTYTAAAGQLLVSVLSANASAFVPMAAPAVTHIKDNFRHPKSPTHSQDLLKILRIILETRLLLTDVQMADQERRDFAATDPVFKTLYADVYRGPAQLGSKLDAPYDAVKLSTEAVQGAGALVCQRAVNPLSAQQDPIQPLLLPEATCAEVCETLFSITTLSFAEESRRAGTDDLVNEAIKALQRSIESYSSGFRPLVEQGMAMIRKSCAGPGSDSAASIQSLCSVLAFVGCANLRPSLAGGMRRFLRLSCALATELLVAMDASVDPSVWCAMVAGVASIVYYFRDACREVDQDAPREQSSEHGTAVTHNTWLSDIVDKYPMLNSVGAITGAATASEDQSLTLPEFCSVADLRDDFLLVSLFLCRQLYRRATEPLEDPRTRKKTLGLSADFTGSDEDAEYRYLHLLSDLASFIVGEMNRSGASSLQFDVYCLTLFRDDFIPVPSPATGSPRNSGYEDSWGWLAFGPLNALAFGVLKSLLPSGVMRLYDMGVAQQLLIEGTSSTPYQDDSAGLPVTRAILAVLANKYKLETFDDLMATLEQHLERALERAMSGPSPEDRCRGLEQSLAIFTLAGSLLRRCIGKQTRGLLRLLYSAPNDSAAGYRLGRALEVIAAPQPFVMDSVGSVQKPLWLQKVYINLVKPMIGAAIRASLVIEDPLIRTNYGVAALHMIKHAKFAIYEDDANDILRIAISTARSLGTGPDAKAALEVLGRILVEAPEAVQVHLRSVVGVCTRLAAAARGRPEWMPPDYAVAAADDPAAEAACSRLALEIVGGLPRVFEARHLLAYVPQVQRELAAACGLRVRDLRKTARVARAAWSDLR